MKKIAILPMLLVALVLLTWGGSGTAFVLVKYSKAVSIRFDEGKFELSAREQARLMKLIEHKDDFAATNVFLVIAHGDALSTDANRDFQAMLAGAWANAISSFYATHAAARFHELIVPFTEPITNDSQASEAGRVEVVIEGFCKPGDDMICKQHWPPSRTIERE
ncbi:hypothetical protein BLA6993_00532 [Burkholderia lata]|uniref:hypothetical protein n=1 Tax=Burkholderia lata (strain ATCC 17760 / DSM 23089 / LMG 22485 / NCIMB 9086 / R18194 / 383) TaxID=482957 RepID=UPI001453F2BD|nr:hypothetical protein [Burkholderia lata]VWB14730.1 hypothetical protein BLA6993_00532 [Burkholderia lata]